MYDILINILWISYVLFYLQPKPPVYSLLQECLLVAGAKRPAVAGQAPRVATTNLPPLLSLLQECLAVACGKSPAVVGKALRGACT